MLGNFGIFKKNNFKLSIFSKSTTGFYFCSRKTETIPNAICHKDRYDPEDGAEDEHLFKLLNEKPIKKLQLDNVQLTCRALERMVITILKFSHFSHF